MKLTIAFVILATLETRVIIDPQSDYISPAEIQTYKERCVEAVCGGSALQSIWLCRNAKKNFTEVVCGCDQGGDYTPKMTTLLTKKRVTKIRQLLELNYEKIQANK